MVKRMGWRMVCVLGMWVMVVMGQPLPVSVVVVDTANRVNYYYDSYDITRFGTNGAVVAAQGVRTDHPFLEETIFADVVAVNGKAVKGNMVIRSMTTMNMNPIAGAGRAIGDITRAAYGHSAWEILTADGRQVGTVMTTWLSGGTPPPGAPGGCTGGNQAVVGGTGAFFGVSGMVCQAPAPVAVAARVASVQESPQNRRVNGGGTNRYVMQLIPRYVPEVVMEGRQAMVLHGDFTPVTASAPAQAGEVLMVVATGLGPTVPGLEPGESFRQEAIRAVSAPVEVVVNGRDVEAIQAVGWPGTADRYRVDFRMPDGVTGTATLQLSAAWIRGGTVRIPVR